MDKCLVTKLVQSVNDSSLPKLGDCVFELLGSNGRFNLSSGRTVTVRVLSGSITYDSVTYNAGDTFSAGSVKFSGTKGSMFALENKYEELPSILAGGSWRLVNASDLTYVIKQTTGLKNQFTVDELMKLNTVGNDAETIFGVDGVEPFIPNFADIANIRARYLMNGTTDTLFSGVSTWSSTSLRNTQGTKGLFTRNCLFASGTDVDNYLINQAACTGGITITSGSFSIINLTTQDGTGRTSASDDAVAAIKAANGTLTINGAEQ